MLIKIKKGSRKRDEQKVVMSLNYSLSLNQPAASFQLFLLAPDKQTKTEYSSSVSTSHLDKDPADSCPQL